MEKVFIESQWHTRKLNYAQNGFKRSNINKAE